MGRNESSGAKGAPEETTLLNDFAVQGEIEAVALDLVGDLQADHHLDDRQDDEGDDRVVDDDGADADDLIDDLPGIAFEQAGVAADTR